MIQDTIPLGEDHVPGMSVSEGSSAGYAEEIPGIPRSPEVVRGRTTSIFDKTFKEEDGKYVLMGLTEDECRPTPKSAHRAVPICGWA